MDLVGRVIGQIAGNRGGYRFAFRAAGMQYAYYIRKRSGVVQQRKSFDRAQQYGSVAFIFGVPDRLDEGAQNGFVGLGFYLL